MPEYIQISLFETTTTIPECKEWIKWQESYWNENIYFYMNETGYEEPANINARLKLYKILKKKGLRPEVIKRVWINNKLGIKIT